MNAFITSAFKAAAQFFGPNTSRKRARGDDKPPTDGDEDSGGVDEMDVAPTPLAVFEKDTIEAFVDGQLQLRLLAGNIRGTGHRITCQALGECTRLGECMATHVAAMEKHAVVNSIPIADFANLSGIPVREKAEQGSGTELAHRNSKRRAAGEGQRSQSHTHLMGAMTSIAFAIHSADYLRAFVLAASFRPAPRPRTLFPPGPAPANPPPNPRT